MDTGEYETNALIVVSHDQTFVGNPRLTLSRNNISSLTYCFYESLPECSQSFLSAALHIESVLRSEGYIVSHDAARQGIWVFHFLNRDGHNGAEQQAEALIDVSRFGLVLGEEGVVEPPTLQKVRAQAQGLNNTATGLSAASPLDATQRQALLSSSQTAISGLQPQEGREAHQYGIETRPGGTTQKTLYENFVASLLLTISTAFCNRAGTVPLDYRTILFVPETPRSLELQETSVERHPVIGTFRTFLTATGSLVLSLAVTRCKGLMCLNDVAAAGLAPQSQRILTAPFGVLAKSQPGIPGDGTMSLAQTPNTQAFSLRSGLEGPDFHWRQACSRYLQYRGISSSALQGSHWVNLLIPRPRALPLKGDQWLSGSSPVIPLAWPGRLCFRKRTVDVSSTSRVGDTVLRGHEECHDPLGSARNWFNSASEREEKASKRNTERAVPTAKESMLRESKFAAQSNDNTLMASQRPSAPAVGVLYPTPPEGIQQAGATPSMDGALSSPGNPLSGPNATSTGPTLDDSPDFVGAEPKRQSHGNTVSDADNIFDDMGGSMFDENDITEADFNFFDEQPGDMDLDASMGDLAPTQNATVALPKAEETTPTPLEAMPSKFSQTELKPVIFAKPELRHARSQNDESGRGREVRSVTSKRRESSPFDPYTVFKRVRASLGMKEYEMNRVSLASGRKTKVFERVDFDPGLPMIDKKYEQGGPFDWGGDSQREKPRVEPGVLPETDYLKRHGRSFKRLRDKPNALNSIMRTLTGLEPPIFSSPSKLGGSVSERDDSSVESDQDDSSYTTEEAYSPQRIMAKHTNMEEDALSQVTSLRDVEAAEEPDHQLAMELPRLAKPDVSETPLSLFFSDPEPLVLDMSLTDEDLIQTAQILTEQAATGSLDICSVSDREAMAEGQRQQTVPGHLRGAFRLLEDIAAQYLGDTSPLRLKSLLDVQDIPLLPQPTRMAPRQLSGRENASEPVRPSNLYQIPSPHLEVRRADTKFSVLPSAVGFWESLGLAPSSGSKTINAVCVYPGWNGMGDSVRNFLDRVKSVYEFLKLGAFDKMSLGPDLEDGLLAYEVDRISTSPDATVTGHGSALVESMEALRGPFMSSTASKTNLVIYIVYSAGNPGTIVEACTAYQRFFEAHQKMSAMRPKRSQDELVLQLVSIDLISSSTFLVVTPAPELVKLCMETYDRCTLFDGPMPAPAIKIEQLFPRIIDFKLTSAPSASLMRENSCIHLAYAQSVDERWVTAAWTDDRGHQQATASYCLRRKGKAASRGMREVADEMWRTTLELISSWRVHWRVIITRSGAMDAGEMEGWVDLARNHAREATVAMILMTVDTSPSLQLLAPVVRLPGSATAFYTTPVSTPQATAGSPEATTATTGTTTPTAGDGAGAGAGAEGDGDTTLVDVTDQTWGAVAGHRLSNSRSVLEAQPALISGYLVKRTGVRAEDAPVVMEVNLVHTDSVPRAYEPLLREMLSHFRGLGTLARARGVVDRETDARPWHVAAAEKAVRALYLLM